MNQKLEGFTGAAGAAFPKFGTEARASAPRTEFRECGEVAKRLEQIPQDRDDSEQSPGVVIPGESLYVGDFPENGEKHELVNIANHVRCISHPLPHPNSQGYAAITDFLNCTFPFVTSYASLDKLFGALAKVVPQLAFVGDRGNGLNGYSRSFDLGEDGAKFCCGGQRETGLLMLPGMACHTVPDWPALIKLLRDCYGARITRWDGAVDDYVGLHSVDWAVEQYMSGAFTNGGNKPSCNQIGNWIEPDGTGRTFYVGKRKNGKLIRIYEKGMQSGEPFHPWVRWELELHNVDRVVPWDVLLNPGKYVVGGYPKVMTWVQNEMSRIKTIKTETNLSYEHLIACASTAYGRLINVMLEVEDSPEKVIERLRKEGQPRRLHVPAVPDGVK
jgi:phage replication initiation protein